MRSLYEFAKYNMNMNRNYLITIFVIVISISFIGCKNDESEATPIEPPTTDEGLLYFPTGMRWKEVLAEPHYLPLDTMDAAIVYEIGPYVFRNEKWYKSVLKNEEPMRLWIRESGTSVFMLTDDYANELKVYDFAWSDGTASVMEYLRETDKGVEKCVQTLDFSKAQTCTVGEHTYDFIRCETGMVIRGIGRVTELNRGMSILGYRVPETILPGLIYRKVLWVVRNDKEIFRSELAEEWIDN